MEHSDPPPPRPVSTISGAMERSATPTPAGLADRVVSAWVQAVGGPGPAAPLASGAMPDVHLLDPACGDGALLLAALRRAGNDPAYARSRLHGIEKDPGRAARARARIAEAAGLGPGTELETQIVCADALDPGTPWPRGTAVLANPPWASYSGRSSRDAGPRQAPADPTGGWPSLHGRFLVRIVEHLEAHGTQGVVLLPQSIASHPGYRELRRRCVRELSLLGPPEFLPEGSFERIQEDALWLTLGPRDPSAFQSDPAGAPWLAPSEPLRLLREALAPHPRLPSGSFADIGVHSGNAAAEIIHRGGPFPGVRDQVPVLEGRNILPYRILGPRAHLRLDLPRTKDRRFRVASAKHYTEIPVVLRQTADRPVASLHEPRGYFRNSVLAVRGVPGLDPAFVAAVLNGPVAAAWHRLHHRDARQRTFPQVKIAHLIAQPFPIRARTEDPGLHDRVVSAVHRCRETVEPTAELATLRTLLLEAFGLPGALLETVDRVDQQGRDYSKAR